MRCFSVCLFLALGSLAHLINAHFLVELLELFDFALVELARERVADVDGVILKCVQRV